MPEQKRQLPIGHWLKQADQALTTRINAVQEANGISRTEWQVLNVLHEVVTATREQIADPLRHFDVEGSLGEAIDGLVTRGLLERDSTGTSGWRLTTEGRRVHGDALLLQKRVRQQAVQGISEADYATTVQVLERLVENLAVALPS
jgi:DNA-binding MarR family transcriptional regulator